MINRLKFEGNKEHYVIAEFIQKTEKTGEAEDWESKDVGRYKLEYIMICIQVKVIH